MDNELLDVVDGFDSVIGTMNRADYDQFAAAGTGFIRAAELFIVNGEGKLWIPTRTDDKTIAPGGYDYAAAGHVTAGEDYLTAIIREAKEEINLDVASEAIEFVAKLKSTSTRYIRTVYLLRTDTTPTYNSGDFKSAEWLPAEELLRRIDAGQAAKSSLHSAVQTLQAYLAGF